MQTGFISANRCAVDVSFHTAIVIAVCTTYCTSYCSTELATIYRAEQSAFSAAE
jgi:hypothetical protein